MYHIEIADLSPNLPDNPRSPFREKLKILAFREQLFCQKTQCEPENTNMAQRILNRFLNQGLLNVGGDDERYKKVLATADSVAEHLRANPREILSFTYTALNQEAGDDDPAIVKTLELLQAEWVTYRNAYEAGVPIQLLRSVILDALTSIAAQNTEVETTFSLIVSSVLPFVDLASEASLWLEIMQEIQSRVDQRAEIAWSVPSRIEPPTLDFGEPEPLKVSIKNSSVDVEGLTNKLQAAGGPTDKAGQAIEGANKYEPNSGKAWTDEFVPRAASAIKEAVDLGSKTTATPIKTDKLFSRIDSVISNCIGAILDRVGSATLGLELRSRLLWWKESGYSPSARVNYNSIDVPAAAALMAFDYQSSLPSTTPGSVVAFFRSALSQLPQFDSETHPVEEYFQAVSNSDHFDPLLDLIENLDLPEGYKPMFVAIKKGADVKKFLNETCIVNSDTKMSIASFAEGLLLELQAVKALGSIVAFNDSAAGDDELSETEDEEEIQA